jgi:hypothetical protein
VFVPANSREEHQHTKAVNRKHLFINKNNELDHIDVVKSSESAEMVNNRDSLSRPARLPVTCRIITDDTGTESWPRRIQAGAVRWRSL